MFNEPKNIIVALNAFCSSNSKIKKIIFYFNLGLREDLTVYIMYVKKILKFNLK